jgi:hypothetical protein
MQIYTHQKLQSNVIYPANITPDSYSEDLRFETGPKDSLNWMKVFVILLYSSNKILISYIKIG